MSQVKNCGTHGKVIRKVIVFFKKYAKLQGQGSSMLLPAGRSCHKKYTYVNYQSSTTHCLKVINKLNVFNDKSNTKVKLSVLKMLITNKRSYNKNIHVKYRISRTYSEKL